MSLYTTSLNSGSNGNCYYIGNDNEAVLVDAGISCRETEKRMKRLGLNINKVKAIFISHEHTDHINGVTVLAGRYQLPVYITPSTLQGSSLKLDEQLIKHFNSNEPTNIGKLSIHAFPKRHDAADPHSFVVEHMGIKIGVFTDIGTTCKHVVDNFRQCHAVFLEANYDEEMLENGRYPYHLKKRISGDVGHLSNRQAFDLFSNHRPPYMTHLFLSHLSKENNSPELVYDLFTQNANKTNVVLASRYKETAVYHIGDNITATPLSSTDRPVQMSLFK